ncbi:unnamed protein product, partial [Brassica rapa]
LFPLLPEQPERKRSNTSFNMRRQSSSGVKLRQNGGPSDHSRRKNPVDFPARLCSDQQILPNR